MKIHILGCGSGLPTMRHNNAAQVVEIEGSNYLIDCGEGTQIWLRRSRIAFTRIRAIFITHLHGDHVFGLMGVLSSFSLLQRTKPIHIFAPANLGTILNDMIRIFCKKMNYEIIYHAVDTNKTEEIFNDGRMAVSTIPLDHHIDCCGYIFRTTERKQAKSYAYCSDTKYIPTLHEHLKDIDLLYHEATYADEHKDKANKYFHSTAKEAALVAKQAGVKQLVIGHYSQRYKTEETLLKEAKSIFDNTILSNENDIIEV